MASSTHAEALDENFDVTLGTMLRSVTLAPLEFQHILLRPSAGLMGVKYTYLVRHSARIQTSCYYE